MGLYGVPARQVFPHGTAAATVARICPKLFFAIFFIRLHHQIRDQVFCSLESFSPSSSLFTQRFRFLDSIFAYIRSDHRRKAILFKIFLNASTTTRPLLLTLGTIHCITCALSAGPALFIWCQQLRKGFQYSLRCVCCPASCDVKSYWLRRVARPPKWIKFR